MIQLETRRLFLRNGSETRPTTAQLRRDYERYVVEHEDPSTTYEQFEDENIFSFLNAQRGSVFGHYMIYPRELDTWVGHCSFFPYLCQPDIVDIFERSKDHSPCSSLEFEIGWAISKDFRNLGYASGGAQALLEYGFDQLKAPRIIALTEHDNGASKKVMEKIGMTLHEIPSTGGLVGVANNPQLTAAS